jgi:hypothetical protein
VRTRPRRTGACWPWRPGSIPCRWRTPPPDRLRRRSSRMRKDTGSPQSSSAPGACPRAAPRFSAACRAASLRMRGIRCSSCGPVPTASRSGARCSSATTDQTPPVSHRDGGRAARASRCDPGVLPARRRRRDRAAVDVALAGQFRSSGPAGGTRPGGGRPSGEGGRPWRRDRPARRAGSAQPCRRRRGTRRRPRGGRVGPADRSRRGRVRLVHRGRAPTVRTRGLSPR